MKNEFRISNDRKRVLYDGNSKLVRDVQHMINDNVNDYDDITDYLNEVLAYGCQSGLESELIYYEDTIKFYQKHKVEIQGLIKERLKEAGSGSISDLLNDWDSTDIFAEEDQNQNLLAWFGYEEICQMILNAI